MPHQLPLEPFPSSAKSLTARVAVRGTQQGLQGRGSSFPFHGTASLILGALWVPVCVCFVLGMRSPALFPGFPS